MLSSFGFIALLSGKLLLIFGNPVQGCPSYNLGGFQLFIVTVKQMEWPLTGNQGAQIQALALHKLFVISFRFLPGEGGHSVDHCLVYPVNSLMRRARSSRCFSGIFLKVISKAPCDPPGAKQFLRTECHLG